jgi:hypothetical protein
MNSQSQTYVIFNAEPNGATSNTIGLQLKSYGFDTPLCKGIFVVFL